MKTDFKFVFVVSQLNRKVQVSPGTSQIRANRRHRRFESRQPDDDGRLLQKPVRPNRPRRLQPVPGCDVCRLPEVGGTRQERTQNG